MTRKEFEPYVRQLADRMRLGHWTFKVDDDPPQSDNAWASVVCWDGRYGATIRLSDALLGETPENQRYSVVHELVHCYFAHSDRIAESDMSPSRSESWRIAMEYGIDAVAQAIAVHMPLPLKVTADHGTPEPA